MKPPRVEVLADFLEAVRLQVSGTATPQDAARLLAREAERNGELEHWLAAR